MLDTQLHYACAIDSILQGKMKRFLIADHAILICNVEGDYFAVDDLCTHEDASLYLGCLKKDQVECSLHGARFNVKTGEPTEEPGEIPLQTYPVILKNDAIYIKITQ